MELTKESINFATREKMEEILDYLSILHNEGYLTTTELSNYWDLIRDAQNAVLDLYPEENN